MSRIGKVPIAIPRGVEVTIDAGADVRVRGPKGENTISTRGQVTVRKEDGRLRVSRRSDQARDKALHGLYHRLITNALTGVTSGYRRELQIMGVGYKAEMQGQELVLSVGRSHPERFRPPDGVKIEVPEPTRVVLTGVDKGSVHQCAAQIRAICPPEPYKGKGIRHLNESVRRKVGKTGVK